MERPFHMYFTEIIIDNNQIKRNVITSKSNWQEGNLLEELNPGEVVVWRGGGVNFLLLLASQNPYPIILVVYSVAKNRPNLSYFWENVIFTIPAVNTSIRRMVQIITTPDPQLCLLEAKNGITWQVIKCTKFLCFLFFLFSKLIVVLFP